MENNNIRTMKFLGDDSWGIPVYKCIENNKLWKDINCGNGILDLYSCNNNLEGEPYSPISKNIEIKLINKETVNKDEKFNYMFLSRLQMDCEYYLGYGNKNKNRLNGDTEQEHIDSMKRIYNSFDDDKKPEWLTYEQILEYEKQMVQIE